MAKKKFIPDIFRTLSEDMSLDEAFDHLADAVDAADVGEWTNLRVLIEPSAYDDGVSLVIRGERLETDSEFEARRKREEKARERTKLAASQKEDSERREYERLKAKYGEQ